MTVELVTGHAGSAHVSSGDVGWFNAGVFGDGKYVLDTGTQLEATVQNANLVTIGVGDALFEGRHIRVSATENVSIDNGAQGVGRHDIICLRYEYDSGTGIESASIAVIKGTGAVNPTDPTIPSGSILSGSSTAYMPLWRIVLDGISVQDPEQMFTDALPLIDATVGALPINRGGTNASTAAGALQNIMAGKSVLYNDASGTTGTVSLSSSASNFNHMRIYATSPYGDVSVDVYNPNGKEFTMSAISTDNAGITTMYIIQQRRAISGTSMTVHDNGYTMLSSSSASSTPVSVSTAAHMKVIRVEAWNE